MSNNPKFRCLVYGCTIPAGIFHHHPVGMPVIGDATAPLNDAERAELESLRRERDWLTREGLKAFSQHSTYVVPADAKIHGGRKLTQALLEAGRIRRETADLGVVFNEAPAPRRSLVRTIGRIAFWIVLAVTVAIWIFAGVKS